MKHKKKKAEKVMRFRNALAMFAAGYPAEKRNAIGRVAWEIFRDKELRKTMIEYADSFAAAISMNYTMRRDPMLVIGKIIAEDNVRTYRKKLEDAIFPMIEKERKKKDLKGLKAGVVVVDKFEFDEPIKREPEAPQAAAEETDEKPVKSEAEPAKAEEPVKEEAETVKEEEKGKEVDDLAKKIVEEAERNGTSREMLEAKLKTLAAESAAFTERMLGLMEEKGISREELAQKVGLSMKDLNTGIESVTIPAAGTVARIAEALDTTVSYLLGKTDVKTWKAADKTGKADKPGQEEGGHE